MAQTSPENHGPKNPTGAERQRRRREKQRETFLQRSANGSGNRDERDSNRDDRDNDRDGVTELPLLDAAE
jgi:hypothetical protein